MVGTRGKRVNICDLLNPNKSSPSQKPAAASPRHRPSHDHGTVPASPAKSTGRTNDESQDTPTVRRGRGRPKSTPGHKLVSVAVKKEPKSPERELGMPSKAYVKVQQTAGPKGSQISEGEEVQTPRLTRLESSTGVKSVKVDRIGKEPKSQIQENVRTPRSRADSKPISIRTLSTKVKTDQQKDGSGIAHSESEPVPVVKEAKVTDEAVASENLAKTPTRSKSSTQTTGDLPRTEKSEKKKKIIIKPAMQTTGDLAGTKKSEKKKKIIIEPKTQTIEHVSELGKKQNDGSKTENDDDVVKKKRGNSKGSLRGRYNVKSKQISTFDVFNGIKIGAKVSTSQVASPGAGQSQRDVSTTESALKESSNDRSKRPGSSDLAASSEPRMKRSRTALDASSPLDLKASSSQDTDISSNEDHTQSFEIPIVSTTTQEISQATDSTRIVGTIISTVEQPSSTESEVQEIMMADQEPQTLMISTTDSTDEVPATLASVEEIVPCPTPEPSNCIVITPAADQSAQKPEVVYLEQADLTDDAVQGLNSFEVLVQVAAQEEAAETATATAAITEVNEAGGSTEDAVQPLNYRPQDRGLSLMVLVPHVSICRRDTASPLRVCDDTSCGCNLVHCPLCAPNKIGVATWKTMTAHFRIHWQRGLNYGEHHICLCMLDCDPAPHLHCPMCGDLTKVRFHHMSTFLIHLTDCENKLLKSVSSNPQLMALAARHNKSVVDIGVNDDGNPSSSKIVQHEKSVVKLETHEDGSLPSSLMVRHPSIIKQGDELCVEMCVPGTGCGCGMYHCPLCTVDKQTFKYQSKAIKHLEFHLKHTVAFQDYVIVICQLSCALLSHYHCPMCGNTFRRKVDVVKHINKTCRGLYKKRKPRGESTADVTLGSGEVDPRRSEVVAPSYYALKREGEERSAEGTGLAVEADYRIQHPHLSIIPKDVALSPVLCDSTYPECGCNNHHCVLCPNEAVAWGYNRVTEHIHSHYRRSVGYKDFLVLPCGGSTCIPTRKRGFHYHCPNCGIIIVLHENFKMHLYKNCKLAPSYLDNIHTNLERYPKLYQAKQEQKSKTARKKRRKELDMNKTVKVGTIRKPADDEDLPPVVNVKTEKVDVEDGNDEEEDHEMDFPMEDAENNTGEPKELSPGKQEEEDDKEKIAETATEKSKNTSHANKSNSPEKLRPLHILKAVSAEVSEPLLEELKFISPTLLLDTLQQHSCIRWTEVDAVKDKPKAFMLHGSWDHLERAGNIIVELIKRKLSSEEEIVQYVKESCGDKRTPEKDVKVNDTRDEDTADVSENIRQTQASEEAAQTSIVEGESMNARETELLPTPEEQENPEVVVTDTQRDVVTLDNSFQSAPIDLHGQEEAIKLAIDTNMNGVFSQPVRCLTCSREFNRLHMLIRHLINCAACWQGHESSMTPGFFRIIDCIQSAGDSLQCRHCGKFFRQIQHYVYHTLRRTCMRNWQSKKVIEYGIKVNPLASVYTCPDCLYSTKSKISIINHYEQHHLVLAYSCTWPGCTKAFASQHSLDSHVSKLHVNPEEERVHCDQCLMPLHASSLASHILSKHSGPETPKLSCPHCSYTNWNSVNLKNHMLNRHASKTFVCKKCNKAFGQKVKLTQHMNVVHLKLKNYSRNQQRSPVKCPSCNITLYQRNLYRHIRTVHDKIKQFTCDKCGKGFTNRHSRWTHSLTHLVDSNNERIYLYRCAVCLKGFNRKWWYNEHVQFAHSHSKRHTCPICAKTFRFKVLYQRHLASHENAVVPQDGHQCGECGKWFTQSRQLKAHISSQHGLPEILDSADLTYNITTAADTGLVSVAGSHSVEEYEEYVITTEDGHVLMTQPASEVTTQISETVDMALVTEDVMAEDQILAGEEISVKQEQLGSEMQTEGQLEGQLDEAVAGMQTVVLETAWGQQITVLVPEGHTLSEEDTHNILQAAQQQETPQPEETAPHDAQQDAEQPQEVEWKHEILLEPQQDAQYHEAVQQEEDTQQEQDVHWKYEVQQDEQPQLEVEQEASWEPEGQQDQLLNVELPTSPRSEPTDGDPEAAETGYMCGMCSSKVFPSIADVEKHIESEHSQEVPRM